MIAGDASTGQRLVTGDAVNTAARLEQAAGPGEIILGDLTYRLAREQIDVEEIPPLTLKGKAEPVPAYLFVGPRSSDRAGDGSAPFVGREAEMGRLTSAFDAVRGRTGAALLTVVGDAGVGKTRLIREFAVSVCDAHVARALSSVRRRHHVLADRRDRPRCGRITSDDALETAMAKIGLLVGELGMTNKDRAAVIDRVSSALGLTKGQFPVAGALLGCPEAARVARPGAAARHDRRRHPRGRADPARPARPPRRAGRGRTDTPAVRHATSWSIGIPHGPRHTPIS